MTDALRRAVAACTRRDTHNDAGTIAMWSVITAMALQPDGRVIVAGQFSIVEGARRDG